MDVLESLAYVDFVVSARVRFVQYQHPTSGFTPHKILPLPPKLISFPNEPLLSSYLQTYKRSHMNHEMKRRCMGDAATRRHNVQRKEGLLQANRPSTTNKQADDTTRDWDEVEKRNKACKNQDQQPASQNQRSSP